MPQTIQDDRLDLIAVREYGTLTSNNMRQLIWDNPETLVEVVFDEGVEYEVQDVVIPEYSQAPAGSLLAQLRSQIG